MSERNRCDWETQKSTLHRGFTMMRTFFRTEEINTMSGADNRTRIQGYECCNWETGAQFNIIGTFKEAKATLDRLLDEAERVKTNHANK